MEFSEYRRLALRTFNHDSPKDNYILGLCGETGEVVDQIKKHLYHKHLNREKILEELGDMLWYIAAVTFVGGLRDDELHIVESYAKRPPYPEAYCLPDRLALYAAQFSGEVAQSWLDGKGVQTRSLGHLFGVVLDIAEHFGSTFDEISRQNIDKLAARYGGRFSTDASIHRNT